MEPFARLHISIAFLFSWFKLRSLVLLERARLRSFKMAVLFLLHLATGSSLGRWRLP